MTRAPELATAVRAAAQSTSAVLNTASTADYSHGVGAELSERDGR